MQRKGARSKQDIPRDILQQLNRGEIASANLVEWLAVDQMVLLQHVLAQHHRDHYFSAIEEAIQQVSKLTVNTLSKSIGQQLSIRCLQSEDQQWLSTLQHHPSDSVRCWLCYVIAQHTDLTLTEKFEAIRPLAQDEHFGVREVAWMALRPYMINELELSLASMAQWADDADPYIRRFATEATRPRGVWCAHILVLKQQPERALIILNRLKSDENRYVQDSVGNWLNDASKSKPEFVRALCAQWQEQSATTATAYIVKKALRTVNAA